MVTMATEEYLKNHHSLSGHFFRCNAQVTVVNVAVGARRAARLGVFCKLLLIDRDTPGELLYICQCLDN